ncbi:MAG: hypothetical protein KDC34_20050 [Saprospiraceae bacterium]|nr:hypothetical protein [Saprospiraceae bacterium]
MKKIVKVSDKHPKKEPIIHKVTFHKLDWLEWITLVLGFWFLLYPEPYRILLGVLLVIPILGIILNGIQKPSIASLVVIDNRDDGKYDVADFIDVAAIMILIRVSIDFKYESFYSLIIPGAVGFLVVLSLLFFTHKKVEKSNQDRKWIYLSVIINIFLYSYAGTYAVNCAYDQSTPQRYETIVLDKKEGNTRKSRRRYSVTIAPWKDHKEKEKMYIPQTQFESVEIGDTLMVNLKKGVFGIPWYYVRKE